MLRRSRRPSSGTTTQQCSDPVALSCTQRWCLRDDLGDVLGQLLGGVIASGAGKSG